MKKITVFLFLISTLNGFIDCFAQGDLYITPNRVVFEGRKYKEILSLANTGNEPATYSISFVQRKMNEDGSFSIIEVPEEGAPFADQYLRVYPRKVTLAAKEGQTIVLQLKRGEVLKDGEYRSHLYFRSEKNYEPLGEETKDTLSNVSVKLTPIYGVSIPIIIRSGSTTAKVSIIDLKLLNENNIENVFFTVHREGNASVYGNFEVVYVPVKGASVKIGGKNGVAVYTNINKRHIKIPLQITPEIDLSKGEIKVKYTEANENKVISEATLTF